VGQCGDLQDDFNLTGHVEAWRELDTLFYSINGAAPTPLAFRAYRRLAADGDFNADIPIARLKPGRNDVRITATYRSGKREEKTVTVEKRTGATNLPVKIEWAKVRHPLDVGQIVDGRWAIEEGGPRTKEAGYDRVFLIGERWWRNYEVKTTMTVHAVSPATSPLSGGNGVGVILRFAGHVTGGPRAFPSGQPKWGYQPFGAIGWLRWPAPGAAKPAKQFYPGDSDAMRDMAPFPEFATGVRYAVRFGCEGGETTRYRFKLWNAGEAEPAAWDWEVHQTSATALRSGGAVLLAHHVDVTFGDVEVRGGGSESV
jgi:hypothetical protein